MDRARLARLSLTCTCPSERQLWLTKDPIHVFVRSSLVDDSRKLVLSSPPHGFCNKGV